MTSINRRGFVGAAVAGGAAALAEAQATSIPIIDTHIHLFDQTRPQGAPYSGGGENREPSLPPRYRKLAAPLGIVGAIVVEASPWIEDNLWVLETMQKDPMMVGTVGDLQPEKPEFKEYLDRYHKNKLFRGIRYGNLWGRSLAEQISNPVFVEGLKLLQQADLSLDTANQLPDLIETTLKVSDKVPGLRIIIDHIPALLLSLPESGEKAAVEANLRELGKRNQVYAKISAAMRIENHAPVMNPAVYKPTFDFLFDVFGENRVVFGSDWPNAAAVNNLPAIVRIAQDYFTAKGRAVAEKYFCKNSIAAYKWVRRDASQPRA